MTGRLRQTVKWKIDDFRPKKNPSPAGSVDTDTVDML
jgi:hypothetical protein